MTILHIKKSVYVKRPSYTTSVSSYYKINNIFERVCTVF